jgi:hypothetical protein
MSALTKSIQRECLLHLPNVHAVPVNAASVIFAGALVMREAAADVAIPGADTSGCKFLGVALEELDNTLGADGSVTATANVRSVRVDREGAYAFAISGTAPKRGDELEIVDDNLVGLAAETSNHVKCGIALRPAPSGGWFVDITGYC